MLGVGRGSLGLANWCIDDCEFEEGGTAGEADCFWTDNQGEWDIGEPREFEVL